MIFNDDRLHILQNESVNNNIDRNAVIRFVTSYGLQSKVSTLENEMIAEFCNKLLNFKEGEECSMKVGSKVRNKICPKMIGIIRKIHNNGTAIIEINDRYIGTKELLICMGNWEVCK